MTETNAAHTKCGKRWVSRGNRTGHCARCHHTFEGSTLFDKHQRITPDGLVECLDPATIEFPTGYPLKQDGWGTWSSTKRFELKEVRGSVVEVSPGGVGFIRTTATREIPGQTEEMRNAKRRAWIEGEG